MKICKDCKILKPITEFGRADSNKDGLSNKCKACVSDYNKAYIIKNKESIKLKKQEYFKVHQDQIAEKSRAYYARNKVRAKIYGVEYRRRPDVKERNKYRQIAYRSSKHLLGLLPTPGFMDFLRTLDCYSCGGIADTVDHIYPVSRGGLHEDSNLAPMCRSCNDSKNDNLISSWKKGTHEIAAREINLWAQEEYAVHRFVIGRNTFKIWKNKRMGAD